MAIAAQKNSKIVPIIIAVLVVFVVAGLGYYVFTTLNASKSATNSAASNAVNTAALNSDQLRYVQYQPANAPVPDNTQVGRENPFSSY